MYLCKRRQHEDCKSGSELGELAVIEDWEHPVELKNEAEATAKAGICKVKTV